ncbi:MAG: TIGR03032 family protein [Gemmataceae bacterium]
MQPAAGTVITCKSTEEFSSWISTAGGSLIVTTYQAGKVAFLGWNGQQVSLLMRDFQKPMGLAIHEDKIALATRNALWVFANAPALAPSMIEHQPGRYDALFLPRLLYCTGDLNIHDLAYANDELWIVNTRFSCLANPSVDFCFTERWRPPFVTDLVPEDRCHLNGLAVVEGKPRYVTALGTTDVPGAWRDQKATGGIVMDVTSNAIVDTGLSMPHSPRWHQGKLWLLNSGAGELLVTEPERGRSEVVCRLPGYLRGLCFVGNDAVVGLCKIRERHIFGGLPIQERGDQLLCGIAVVDTTAGRPKAIFEFTEGCHEIYDVGFLPGIHRANILNLQRPEVYDAFPTPLYSYWLRPSSELPLDAPAGGHSPPA